MTYDPYSLEIASDGTVSAASQVLGVMDFASASARMTAVGEYAHGRNDGGAACDENRSLRRKISEARRALRDGTLPNETARIDRAIAILGSK